MHGPYTGGMLSGPDGPSYVQLGDVMQVLDHCQW